MTEALIEATIALCIGLAGVALGAGLQREVIAVAAGAERRFWPWLSPQRMMSALGVLIAVSGILTAVSVRSCQSAYNTAYGVSQKSAMAATDLLYESLIGLADGVLDETLDPLERAGVVRAFGNGLKAAKALRESSPLPAQPQC